MNLRCKTQIKWIFSSNTLHGDLKRRNSSILSLFWLTQWCMESGYQNNHAGVWRILPKKVKIMKPYPTCWRISESAFDVYFLFVLVVSASNDYYPVSLLQVRTNFRFRCCHPGYHYTRLPCQLYHNIMNPLRKPVQVWFE